MRILVLSPWCPWPADNGSKLRIYHLLRGLAHNHTVDLLSFCPETLSAEQEHHLRSVCHNVWLLHESPFAVRRAGRLTGLLSSEPRSVVRTFSQTMAARVRQAVHEQHYDVLIASEMHTIPYALLVDGTPLVLEELELGTLYEQYVRETHPIHRLRHGLTWWKTRRYISTVLRHFVGVSVVSEAEHALIAGCIARLPQSEQPVITTVPNGVDVAHYAGTFGPPDADTLIYPGALSYDANFDAVAHFIQEIQPRIRHERPATRLHVTGRATPDQVAALPHDESVAFSGYLDDVRPAIARAWAEVVPLRKGGGTRLKVLEALALGTPVVSTSKGVEGLDLVPGRDVLVANTPQAFAEQTLHLLRSPTLRRELAEHGRRAAARYDWSYSVQRLEHLLEHALARG